MYIEQSKIYDNRVIKYDIKLKKEQSSVYSNKGIYTFYILKWRC